MAAVHARAAVGVRTGALHGRAPTASHATSTPVSLHTDAKLLFGRNPDRCAFLVMPLILLGLALALDVSGAASGLGARAQWASMGSGWSWRFRPAPCTDWPWAFLEQSLQPLQVLGAMLVVAAVAWLGLRPSHPGRPLIALAAVPKAP